MSSFIVFRILCVNLSLGFKNLNLYNIFKITSRHKYLVNGNAYEIVVAQLNKSAENEINTQTGFCKIHCLCKINKKKTNIQVLKFVRLNKMAVFLGNGILCNVFGAVALRDKKSAVTVTLASRISYVFVSFWPYLLLLKLEQCQLLCASSAARPVKSAAV